MGLLAMFGASHDAELFEEVVAAPLEYFAVMNGHERKSRTPPFERISERLVWWFR